MTGVGYKMSKLTVIGLVFLFAGFIVLGYQGMLALKGTDKMGSDFIWTDLSLGDLLYEGVFDWINSISISAIRRVILLLLKMPLFLHLLSLATICFFIQAFRK